jgi:DNA-directed RNA polymerase subunit M/transcription elongation factor TFIIS
MRPRACPRCGGALYRETDIDGFEELACLQCGYRELIGSRGKYSYLDEQPPQPERAKAA